MSDSPIYDKVYDLLKEAHEVCLNHPDRPPLGMSHGPFSNVNQVLGIVGLLEEENIALKAALNSKHNEQQEH
jgi:hypothetical protein